MKELADSGKITIGVKYDQPGLGFKGATDDMPVGFDVEIGKILVAVLGIAPEDITWKETISDNREPFLAGGRGRPRPRVVLHHRRAPRRSSARPAPTTSPASSCWSKSDSDIETLDDVKGKEVCSVTGSTSLENIKAEGAKPRGFDTYSECVDQVLERHRRRDDHRRRDPARLRRARTPTSSRSSGSRSPRSATASATAWTRPRCASGSTTRSPRRSEDGTGPRPSRPPSASRASRRPSRRPGRVPGRLTPDHASADLHRPLIGRRRAARPAGVPQRGARSRWTRCSTNFDLSTSRRSA